MLVAVEHIVFIDFIRDHDQIAFLRQHRDFLQSRLRQHSAVGLLGVTITSAFVRA